MLVYKLKNVGQTFAPKFGAVVQFFSVDGQRPGESITQYVCSWHILLSAVVTITREEALY